MTKKFLYAFIACGFALLAQARGAVAQTQADEHKFEVGAEVTSIHLATVDTTVTATPAGTFNAEGLDVTTFGYGGRFGYNVNRYVAVEAEFNYLPERNFNEVEQSRREQFFAGVRVGKRWEKAGVFAKLRPGVMHFDELPFHTVCTATGCRQQDENTFALDAGAVVEYYPTARTILRFDAGDTIVHFSRVGPTAQFASSVTTPAQTTHNFQASAGFGFRF
ncbi:MAG: outer membrane beta-barrel protein [Pyrinomonadaceae bacterium]